MPRRIEVNNAVPLHHPIGAVQGLTLIEPNKTGVTLGCFRQRFTPLFEGFGLLFRNNMLDDQTAIKSPIAMRL